MAGVQPSSQEGTMKKSGRLFLSGFLMFLMGCCAGVTTAPVQYQVPFDPERQANIELEKELTVSLVKRDEDGVFAYCAGLWIAKGMILTASHCVDEEGPIIRYTIYKDKKIRMALVAAAEEHNDLALLYVDPSSEPQHPTIDLTEELEPNTGEEVDIIGHTVGYTWSYSKGNISAIRQDLEGPSSIKVKKVVQISAPVWMGNSGGGAFDTKGRFVGLCSWISRRGPFLSFFIHRDIIKDFMLGKELPVP